jgi:hypothetical protein
MLTRVPSGGKGVVRPAYAERSSGVDMKFEVMVVPVAQFSDPDGNGWLDQEIATRLPGR